MLTKRFPTSDRPLTLSLSHTGEREWRMRSLTLDGRMR